MAKEMSIEQALRTYKVGGEFFNRFGCVQPYVRDIFADAKTGDKFLTREGKIFEYIGKKDVKTRMLGKIYICERHLIKHPTNRILQPYFPDGRFDDGFVPYDIIAKYPENEI